MGSRKTDEGGQILELDDRIAFVAGSTETGRDAMGEKSLDERPCRFALYIHCKDTRQACREIPIYNFFFLTSNDKQAHSQPNDMSALVLPMHQPLLVIHGWTCSESVIRINCKI